MRILHTSDWHLGRSLMGMSRCDEHDQFLTWLLNSIEEHKIDVVLVAGDVFDTTTPSNRAQKQYFDFLSQISRSCCRHVIVIGGNHDSPTLLDAPRQPLLALNVHVIGCARSVIGEEVIALRDEHHQVEMIVCAVPYLRDRDVRKSEPGESLASRDQKLISGIRSHYNRVADIAQSILEDIDKRVPVVAMGHLFTAGARTIEGDGVRDLYVGSLAHPNSNVFPESFDYVALGHLHMPQRVGGSNKIVYCGSPIPMGFGEANQKKVVCVVEFSDTGSILNRKNLAIPRFQQLSRVEGDLEALQQTIKELVSEESNAWLEVAYTGDDVVPDLADQIESLVMYTHVTILRIVDKRKFDQVIRTTKVRESLDELDVHDVFERLLDKNEISEEQRVELRLAYNEIVNSVQEEDPNQE